MIARAGTGWQAMLADLSLILFMVTAAVLAKRPAAPPALPPSPTSDVVQASERSHPLAIWIAGPGAPRLGDWLAAQSADPRQLVTVTAQYAPGGQAQAIAEASRLVAEAGEAGISARIVIEPGNGPLQAALAYDAPPQVAHSLLKVRANADLKERP
ncbi:hypothetical protein [Novosphingobium aquimarinum]|uniref:hypothetical protein n=1 Tax=Novosphingobium aquimarinum TaxID=2682494 RepID=UPI0012EB07C0|nr:hypothetical protein [Novosphingobium aquimarinum]